jgi:MoaA/NifB/PqqE/SkfB family radical SAM enzyme
VWSYARIVPSLWLSSFNPFPRRANALVFITNRCNSKCLQCDHWKQPTTDLPARIIQQLLESKTIGNKSWLVEGGEVFFHPEIDEILKLLKQYRANYTLFTNGTLPNKVEKAVTDFKIKSVNVSLDGPKETYARIRGFDGYDRVIKTIDAIKDKTSLQVNFTISPWNTYEDYEYVKRLCAEKKVALNLNIYSQGANDGVLGTDKEIDSRYEKIDFPYIRYYNQWVRGLKVPCYSVLFTACIFPTGDVNLCVSKFRSLGNLHEKTIDEIWNSGHTLYLHETHRRCNQCWVACFKAFDVKLALLKGLKKEVI